MKLIKLAPQLLAARLRPLTLAVLALLLLVSTAFAQQGAAAFNYQGQIFDSDGQPVNGVCDFDFGLYGGLDSQTKLAAWQMDGVTVTDRRFWGNCLRWFGSLAGNVSALRYRSDI